MPDTFKGKGFLIILSATHTQPLLKDVVVLTGCIRLECGLFWLTFLTE